MLDVRLLDSLDPGDGSNDHLRLGVALDAPSAGVLALVVRLAGGGSCHILLGQAVASRMPEDLQANSRPILVTSIHKQFAGDLSATSLSLCPSSLLRGGLR